MNQTTKSATPPVNPASSMPPDSGRGHQARRMRIAELLGAAAVVGATVLLAA
jgi:hypothetical protein